MSPPIIVPLDWIFYDQSRGCDKSGLYLTTNRDWGHGPRLVGESLNIAVRLGQHARDAKNGGITLFQPSFSRSVYLRTPTTLILHWEKVVKDEMTLDLYVPGDPVKVSGLDLWQSCPKLISVVETGLNGFSSKEETKKAKDYLQLLESRVQQDAKNYYAGLIGREITTWRVPRSHSELFGKQWHPKGSPKLNFTIQYSLNGEPMRDANVFFEAVAGSIP